MIKAIQMKLNSLRKKKEANHALLKVVVKNNALARQRLDDLKATINGNDDWFIRVHRTWTGNERREKNE